MSGLGTYLLNSISSPTYVCGHNPQPRLVPGQVTHLGFFVYVHVGPSSFYKSFPHKIKFISSLATFKK
jgi:hypothetical protein